MKRRLFIMSLAVIVLSIAASAHEIIKGTLKSKLHYPGTEREIQVYVPDAYDASSPACLYVGLDGILCNAPNVMDSLIAVGKMPVTIGVFIQPGVIKDKDGNVVRYNRSNEFDMTTGTFASFINDEVLPWVENLTTARGLPIKLSHRGADGMIFGLSSGGIAAFTAAWHRPELFSRVFCGVGTFVAMRGGNDLQAIVRKSEPRPLRIFLQDGTNDVWNPLFGPRFGTGLRWLRRSLRLERLLPRSEARQRDFPRSHGMDVARLARGAPLRQDTEQPARHHACGRQRVETRNYIGR